MEKSQWDLKRIRFQRRRLTRLDDFVLTYQESRNALLREFYDTLRTAKKRKKMGSTCGLFALVFAQVLCEGIRPEQCKFTEGPEASPLQGSQRKQGTSVSLHTKSGTTK
ncbi:hypothetical protein SKAU_G00210180 [Synaphobranchus kaupii]|uniref:Uncharacterized protein n=1 Tax=Synaphobranchus kaupii TaxID=118154 RepID=A0A9Q1F993_SYNKA|nr:hypothetical protein SKAU_G00210180 [Synaphobranchus kaupii]